MTFNYCLPGFSRCQIRMLLVSRSFVQVYLYVFDVSVSYERDKTHTTGEANG